jgi:hypothetical protein
MIMVRAALPSEQFGQNGHARAWREYADHLRQDGTD